MASFKADSEYANNTKFPAKFAINATANQKEKVTNIGSPELSFNLSKKKTIIIKIKKTQEDKSGT